jgi:hypothetical protein
MTAVLFRVNETPMELEYTGELSQLQAAVGGYVECIQFRINDQYFDAWVNEEGLLRGLEENAFVSDLIGYAFQNREFMVVGDVLITGQAVDGETRALSQEELDTLRSFWNTHALAMHLTDVIRDIVKDVPPPPPMHTLN